MDFTEEFIKRLYDGEHDAWRIFSSHANRLVGAICRNMGLYGKEADAIITDAVARVYFNLRSGKVEDPSKLIKYLGGVARNCVFEYLRRRRDHPMDPDELENMADFFEESYVLSERAIALEDFLEAYAEKSKDHRLEVQLLRANVVEEMTLRELAEVFDMSKSSIKRKIDNVKNLSRSWMSKNFN